MTYQPFLPEAAAGNLEPRHLVVPLREVLPRCEIVSGRVTPVISPTARARRAPGGAAARRHRLRSRLRPRVDLPDAADPRPRRVRHRVQDRRGGDPPAQPRARPARPRRLHHRRGGPAPRRSPSCSSAAGTPAWRPSPSWRTWPATPAATSTASARRHALVPGGGHRADHARGGRGHGRAGRCEQLRGAASTSGSTPGWSPRSTTTSCSATATEFDADTLVWTAGVKPNPLTAYCDLPLDDKGRVRVTPMLSVEGTDYAFSAGDCAAVPDLTNPGDDHRAERPARGTAGQGGSPRTSGHAARASGSGRTGTSTPGRWRASACTRAWPRSTA